MSVSVEWFSDARPIETAPTDGTEVYLLSSAVHGLPMFETRASYHPDAGWCLCELRTAIAWRPVESA